MKVRVLIAATVAVASALSVSGGTVVNSKHDLRVTGGGTPVGTGLDEVCVPCHTPHQASTANSQDPLWNHTATATTTFGVYGSATMNATPTEIGGAAIGGQAVSVLCMSCHDGTVSVISMYNPPNSGTPTVAPVALRIDSSGKIISNANMGTSLSDDHPINFTYNTSLASSDGGLKDPAATPAVAALLNGGTVQCSSCHSSHDPTFVPFLRVSNSGSALCLICHIK